jgi:CHAD domain-containing protein
MSHASKEIESKLRAVPEDAAVRIGEEHSKPESPDENGYDPRLSAETTAGQAFTSIGLACLRQLIAHEPATIRRDPEALHQMRIALRRLRAAISLFSEIVSDGQADAIKAELKWLGREFAPARDLDSLLTDVIRPLQKQQADAPGFASVARIFARERLEGYRQARAAVQSPRFRALIADTTAWIEAGPWSKSADAQIAARRDAPIETLAGEQLSRRRKKIRRRGRDMASLNPEELHALRIQVKKLRYATEFFSGVYPGKKAEKRQEKFRAALKQLQTCLGGFNDIAMRKALCAAILTRPGRNLSEEQNRHRAFAAGLIIGDQHAQIRKLMNRARKAYARFDDAKPFWT